jgi:hypothetical protein
MLFRRAMAEGIVGGRVTLAFRRWKRAAVKPGARLRTTAGVVEIVDVTPIAEAAVSEQDAPAAGFASRAALLASLGSSDGTLFRIALRFAGEDPRASLREQAGDVDAVAEHLARLDGASRRGPWTHAALRLIGSRPGIRAAELAAGLGRETLAFKRDVRKLKELGLTESLDIGYRLSPRGRAYLTERDFHKPGGCR